MVEESLETTTKHMMRSKHDHASSSVRGMIKDGKELILLITEKDTYMA